MQTTSLPDCAGSYVLLLEACRFARVTVGKAGEVALQPGCYLYVGSAFGPGGLGSRLGRHLHADKNLHWHLDYLRPWLRPVAVWYSCDEQPQEDNWAAALAAMPGIEPVVNESGKGFGASDRSAVSHLFFSRRCPDLRRFQRHLQDLPHAVRPQGLWLEQ